MSLLSAGSLIGAESDSGVDDTAKARVRGEIERYVAADIKLKKYFFLTDPRSDKTLRLLFDHVHEGVSASPKGYGVCVDFKDKAGKVYDVDIFVSLGDTEARVEEIVLHKVDGKPLPQAKEGGK
ncbi:MAG: hypothetical protein HY568_01415 [Candidatus Latescibacteria bacterium]|nr:hypothetical protein [Candidatus Latescibacterota bacterium]